MKRGYQCDTCKKFVMEMPWVCPGCGKETCENCFDKYAHCFMCCASIIDDEILKRNAIKFGWDF